MLRVASHHALELFAEILRDAVAEYELPVDAEGRFFDRMNDAVAEASGHVCDENVANLGSAFGLRHHLTERSEQAPLLGLEFIRTEDVNRQADLQALVVG